MIRRTGRSVGRDVCVGFLWFVLLGGLCGPIDAATLTVLNTSDSGAGSLRQAIADAAAGDTIDFDPSVTGTINLVPVGPRLARLVIDKSLTILGPGARTLTIDAGLQSNCFYVVSGTVSISGLTIAHGRGDTDVRQGGAIYLYTGDLTVRDCAVTGNVGDAGGGGIFANTSTVLSVDRCTFTGNHTGLGFGGAPGGALYNFGNATVTNSTFHGNFARHRGGAIQNRGTLTVSHCTIKGNSTGFCDQFGCAGSGGGISVETGTANMSRTILSRNTSAGGGPDCSGTLTGNNNLVRQTAGCSVTGTDNLLDIDPGFPAEPDPPQNNGGQTDTFALPTGSAAIDAAGPVSGLTVDQRGVLRPQGPACDIGAFELGVECPTIDITPAILPNPIVGSPYDETLAGSGGTSPYTFEVTEGALPEGLSLSSDGSLTGTASSPGSATFTVRATDDYGCTGELEYTITIDCPAITVTPETLPNGTGGTPYSQSLGADGGSGPYSFSITAGRLPVGFELNPNGTLSGTAAPGISAFMVTATDASLCTGSRSYDFEVDCPTLSIAPSVLPDAAVGSAYSQSLTGSGGRAPYSFAVTGGALPDGLSLSASGLLSGTPTASGTSSFTIQAVDADGCAVSAEYSVTVTQLCPTITLSPATLPGGIAGAAYSQSVTAVGGSAPYGFQVTAGALPQGLVLGSGGLLSGTLGQTGTFAFTITATDGATCTGSQAYTLSVACSNMQVKPVNIASGTVGTAYSQTLTANGGTSPYAFAISAGSLGSGLGLSPGGVISGTPATAGTSSFTVTASDRYSCQASRNYSLVIGKASTSTVLFSSLNPSVVSESVAFTATVSSVYGTPSGTVTFRDGATVLGSAGVSGGAASITVSTLTAGSHSITAAYGGGANHATSTSPTLTQVVTAAAPAGTTTAVTASINPSVYGQPVTFVASVSTSGSGTPGGTVTFYDGSTALGSSSLSGGSATFVTSALAAGSHSIVATYAGSTAFTGSSSAPLGQSVVSATTATSLDASPKSARVGQTVTLKAAITVTAPGGGTPAGSVNFFDGATRLNSSPIAVSAGKASFSTTFASIGTHNITAVYTAGPNFVSSTSPVLGFQVK